MRDDERLWSRTIEFPKSRISCKFEADADFLLPGPFMKHLSAQWQVIQTLKFLAEKGFK